ncbi:hypothetical protein VTL71DRAFT_2543 [Oculimacula yallundae]|uniref:Uncharacterized protein n=1 Tax=Oculimacula yallundae TaxID=86028 RepID=A0ABR4C946_9HELO
MIVIRVMRIDYRERATINPSTWALTSSEFPSVPEPWPDGSPHRHQSPINIAKSFITTTLVPIVYQSRWIPSSSRIGRNLEVPRRQDRAVPSYPANNQVSALSGLLSSVSATVDKYRILRVKLLDKTFRNRQLYWRTRRLVEATDLDFFNNIDNNLQHFRTVCTYTNILQSPHRSFRTLNTSTPTRKSTQTATSAYSILCAIQ